MRESGSMSRRRIRPGWIVGGVALLAVAIVVVVVSAGSGDLKSYKILNPAMAPALRAGQSVSVDPGAKRPGLEQITMFHAPTGATAVSCGNPNQGGGHPQACDEVGDAKSNATF